MSPEKSFMPRVDEWPAMCAAMCEICNSLMLFSICYFLYFVPKDFICRNFVFKCLIYSSLADDFHMGRT